MEKRYTVYMIECDHPNHIYIGQTSQYEYRMEEHRKGRGMPFTTKYGVKNTLIMGIFSSRDEALVEEKRIRRSKFEEGFCVNRCYGKCLLVGIR